MFHELLHYGLRRFMTRPQYMATIQDLYDSSQTIRDVLIGGFARKRAMQCAAMAAKDVIERDAFVKFVREEREDSFYFSAPVDIDGRINIETVLVHRD